MIFSFTFIPVCKYAQVYVGAYSDNDKTTYTHAYMLEEGPGGFKNYPAG